jgi:hypothetical protein
MGLKLSPDLERKCLELAASPQSPEPIAERGPSEKEWQWRVVNFAEAHGWKYYHTYDSRRSPEGFPDLVLLRPGRIVVAELKTDKGKVTAAQQEWLEAWQAAGAEVYVWRPSMWAEVQEVLV